MSGNLAGLGVHTGAGVHHTAMAVGLQHLVVKATLAAMAATPGLASGWRGRGVHCKHTHRYCTHDTAACCHCIQLKHEVRVMSGLLRTLLTNDRVHALVSTSIGAAQLARGTAPGGTQLSTHPRCIVWHGGTLHLRLTAPCVHTQLSHLMLSEADASPLEWTKINSHFSMWASEFILV